MPVAEDSRLEVVGEGFTLPWNAILVGPPASQVRLIEDLPEGMRREAPPRPARPHLFDYAAQPIEERREYRAILELPEGLARAESGEPILSGPTPLRLTVDASELGRALEERCEAVFYLDGEFIFENEVSFLPITWTWDVTTVEPGVHYLSANVRSYEGYFGTQTLRVVVAPRKGQSR
jgi:hypothetical protein